MTPTPLTAASEALLNELAESPLPGARYAHHVVSLRLPAIEAAVRAEREAEVTRLALALVALADVLEGVSEVVTVTWPPRHMAAIAAARAVAEGDGT